ncbi:MAG TPA: DUF1631 family protein [Rhodanobacteraceae bacterium]|nr:DUF1631 family protein [Rhodanobacteraceae bacterium]
MPESSQSIADRTDLPPRVRELLAQQLAEFGARLEPLLHGSLIAFRHQLGKQGERSRNNTDEQTALYGMQQAKRLDGEIMDRFRHTFESRLAAFDRPLAAPAHKAALESGLSLIDNQEFEESVLLDDIATRAEMRASRQLFELGYRHGVLAAKAPFEAEELALGPRALLRGLSEIARAAGFSREHRMFWYGLCDTSLVNAADEVYAALNEQLIPEGILPSLRPYLPRRGSAPRTRGGKPDEPAGESGSPDAQGNDAALQSLRGLLARRRELLKLDSECADAQPASAETVQAALATLQQRAAGGAQPDARGVQRAVQHLQEDLLAELRRFAPDAKGLRLTSEQRDVLDLVSLLFERLLDETRNGGAAQRLLARLQLPLLRAALADPGVFGVRTHPARRLLNNVVETADLWIDGSEGEIDNALLDKLRHTVEHTLATFAGDPALFQQQAVELENHVHALRRRAEVAERRQRDAAQGRERLEQARAQAGAAIAAQVSGRKLATLTRALLEQAWTDALALAILRHGEGSDEFARALEVAAALLREPGERDDTRLLGELEAGLVQVGLHASEATQLAHRVLDREAPGADEKATQTELLVKLKNRPRLGEQDGGEAAAAAALNEEEQRHLARLRGLPFNTWFECVINEQGQRVQRKLIWYADSGRCLLVNARGTAAAECTLQQLARQMAAGRTRLLPRQEESMIDRAWHTVIASLRQFARADASVSP